MCEKRPLTPTSTHQPQPDDLVSPVFGQVIVADNILEDACQDFWRETSDWRDNCAQVVTVFLQFFYLCAKQIDPGRRVVEFLSNRCGVEGLKDVVGGEKSRKYAQSWRRVVCVHLRGRAGSGRLREGRNIQRRDKSITHDGDCSRQRLDAIVDPQRYIKLTSKDLGDNKRITR